jgi:DNA polymerase-1
VSKPEPGTIYLVDGTSNVYRAYFAIRAALTAEDGTPTNALWGFTQILRKLLADLEPEYLAVAFDPKGPTFRHEMYAEYKAQRPQMPVDLRPQVALAPEVCHALGVPTLIAPGFEADDVLASVARQAREAGHPVVVVASDKDMLQIVGDGISLLNPHKNNLLLDAVGVENVFGVRPDQVTDVLALWGDSSDNVPGVTGIGEKGAKQIIADFGDLEAAISRAAEIRRKSYRENLQAEADQARFSKRLVTLRTDAPVSLDLERLRLAGPDRKAAYDLFRRLGFQSILEEFAGAVETVEADYRAILDAGELEDLAQRLRGAGRFAVDTETTSRNPHRATLVGMSFAREEGKAWYLPLAHRYMGAPDQVPLERALEVLRPLLEDPGVGKIGQNIKYDLLVLEGAGISLRGIEFDTMLASYMLDPGARHGMDDLALRHLGHRTIHYEDVAGKGAKQVTLDQVDVDRVRDYAAEDADVTWRLYRDLEPRLQGVPQERLFREVELPLVPVLAAMESHGVGLDVDYLAGLSVELGAELHRLEAEIHEAAGGEFNINSPRQLAEVLFDRLGLASTRRTAKTKSRSTSQGALEELAEEHELPRRVLEYRGLAKLRSTYVDALPALVDPRTGKVHTSFNQTVAATGRLSSSDPNLQNIPVRTEQGRRIRKAFLPSPGNLLLSADYSQVELRIAAHMSGDPALTEAFRRGEDIHRATAAAILGVDPEEVTAAMRGRAKAVNFGILYGMSAFRLAREQGMERREAQGFIDEYFGHFRGVREMLDGIVAQARESGKVETLFGRVRYLPDLKSSNAVARKAAERAAINTPIQGTAADLIKMAMLAVEERLRKERLAARMILQVHDELVLDVPASEVEAVRSLVRECMETVHPMDPPLKVDTGVGENWLDAK